MMMIQNTVFNKKSKK